MVALDRKNFHIPENQRNTAEYRRGLEAELFSFMGAGMNDEVRTRTMATPRPPQNAEELLLAARSVESEMANSTTKNTFSVDVMKEEIEKVVKEVIKERKDNNKDTKDTRKTSSVSTSTRCYRCQGFGHLSPSCPNKEKVYPNYNRGGRGRGGSRGGRGGRGRGGYGRGQSSQFGNYNLQGYQQSQFPQTPQHWNPPSRPKQTWTVEENQPYFSLPQWSNDSGN